MSVTSEKPSDFDSADPARRHGFERQGREFDPNTGNTDGLLWQRTSDLRHHCPVFHSDQMDGFTAVVDHSLINVAVRDWKTFSSAYGALRRQEARTFRLYPFELDPPLHTRIKGCLSPLFTKARVKALDPVARLEIKVAIEEIFGRLPGIRLLNEDVFGQGQNWGPTALHLTWDQR